MNVNIINIGHELLIGDTVNTNASWLGSELTRLGFTVRSILTIGDNYKQMMDTFKLCSANTDLVIITGGLGPTHDDITKKCLSDYFEVGLKRDENVFEHVKSFFEKRGLPFSSSNVMQADILENAETLFNYWGTAPGMWIEENGTYWAITPGVPAEMKHIFTKRIVPKLEQLFPKRPIISQSYLEVAGIGESTLRDTLLVDVEDDLNDHLSLAYLPHHDGITLRISASGMDTENVNSEIEKLKNRILNLAGEFIYSSDKESMVEVVGKLLTKKGWKLAVAESCTGGGVGYTITKVPNSSAYFEGGIICYSNEVKEKELKVPQNVLINHGAVSSEVAEYLAKGVRKKLSTDIGVSITGIAGPGGETETKPVGLIWFGLSTEETTFSFKIQLTKSRSLNRKRSIMIILDAVRRYLMNYEKLPYGVERVQST